MAEVDITGLQRAVERACEEMDHLRDRNRELSNALRIALTALEEGSDFQGEVLEVIAEARAALNEL